MNFDAVYARAGADSEVQAALKLPESSCFGA